MKIRDLALVSKSQLTSVVEDNTNSKSVDKVVLNEGQSNHSSKIEENLFPETSRQGAQTLSLLQ